MKFIINVLLLLGIVWLLIFLGTLFGLIGLMVLRIFTILGIPTFIVFGVYKLFKR